MAKPFFEQPILNSPYAPPTRHHALSADGQPLDAPPIEGRRRSELITPVPQPKAQRGRARQDQFVFDDGKSLSQVDQAYNPIPIINEIRQHVASWRALKNPADWGVTPTTQRLLLHWRDHEFINQTPFFCQIEAVETVIWLTEVASRLKQYAHLWRHVRDANAQANPELLRLALKMATGAGKTTVMAMLIAWQTLNAVRQPASQAFTRGFLIVTPGVTIRDRLQVLLPSHRENYYAARELVPADLLPDMGKAKIVLTNYHAFKKRVVNEAGKVARALMRGWRDEAITVEESEGAMLQRACGDILGLRNVVVINDEAHHCYRERPRDSALAGDEQPVAVEDREEAKRNAEAARLWISGVEALKRKVGVRAVYDLSATPFFLRGSGYVEGTLFPWTVTDFSLIDAIESGIVKLPRVPVADNLPTGEMPIYRNLWAHIGKSMPKKVGGGDLDPLSASFPPTLQTALFALYGHYKATHDAWRAAGIDVPPVFIVVCNNTATSKLVYEWIAGFERGQDDDRVMKHPGHLPLFSNFEGGGQRRGRPATILIDSAQLESGEALDGSFRDMAADEIAAFSQRLIERHGAGAKAAEIDDAKLLREVMNTVGRKGELGEQIHCVVSVGMLTEGWDANTVTHILGIRAFGSQLLCEQVVGRGLRRQSYELNGEGLFSPEYADILGIPFSFAADPVVAPPTAPKPSVRVQALRERADCEIIFPRVQGYRVDLPRERLRAEFGRDSQLEVTPELVGPTRVRMEGLVGESAELDAETALADVRPATIAFQLTKRLLNRYRDTDGDLPTHLFASAQPIVREWLDEHLVTKGVPRAAVLYAEIAELAVERIYLACQRAQAGTTRIKAVLDPYNTSGSTRSVAFTTTKPTYATSPSHSHVSHVVCDSGWEAEFARVLEAHPRVLAYVKNQGLGFEVPYRDGAVARRYLPDFIIRLDRDLQPPLNLVVEVKGYRGGDAQLKAETMQTLWTPGVNNLGGFGEWAFAEFEDVFEMESAFERLVSGRLTAARQAA